jgi:hypothetical protein
MTTYIAAAAASVVTKFGYDAAKAGADYIAKTGGNITAVRIVYATKDGVKEIVKPYVGQTISSLLGEVVAGHSLNLAKQEGDKVAVAIQFIGDQVLTAAVNHSAKKEEISATEIQIDTLKNAETPQASTASKVYDTLVAVGTIGAGIALATGAIPLFPVAAASTAYAAVQAFPKIMGAAMSKVDPNQEISLTRNVFIPVATDVLISAGAQAAYGITAFRTVDNAYFGVLRKGKQIAKGLTWLMPKQVQDFAEKAAVIVAIGPAANHAMSSETLKRAEEYGEAAKDVTKVTLKTIDALAQHALANNKSENTAWQITKDVFVIVAGVTGGAVIVTTLPAAAAAGLIVPAFVKQVPGVITWTKAYLSSKEKPAEAQKEAIEAPTVEKSINEQPAEAA